jgi:integrase
MDFAIRMAEAEKAGLHATLTTAQARKLFNEALERVGDEPLSSFTVKGWITEWLEGKKASLSSSTAERYGKPLGDFIDHLGVRGDLPLAAVNPKDIRTFRDAQRKAGRAAATCNFSHKALASVFEAAKRQNLITANPCHAVDYLQTHQEKVEKGTFSPAEVSKLIAACKKDEKLKKAGSSADWKGIITLGFYTGMRLNDCLSLTWGNVDLPGKVITYMPQKTAAKLKKLTIPMHVEVEDFLLKHPAGKRDADPVFPSVHKLSIGGNRGASRTFSSIMDTAGLASGILREKAGNAGHAVAEHSFHSLRHSLASALSAAGVMVEERNKITGHSDERMGQHYTHVQIAELRVAIDKMPSLPGRKAK